MATQSNTPNNNGGGQPQGGTNGNAQNPDNNNGAALSALDRLVQMQDAMDNQSGGTGDNNNNHSDPLNRGANSNGQPDPNEDETNLTGNENANEPTELSSGSATSQDGGDGTDGNEGAAGAAPYPQQLLALDEDVREQVLDLAQDIADGVVNLGEIKRGHRLALDFAAERNRLNSENQALREQVQNGGNRNGQPVLNTPDQVQARIDQLQDILDWCEENPDGGDFGNGDNAKSFNAEEVRAIRRDTNKELRRLPAQLQAAQQQAAQAQQFAQSQRQARTQAEKLFPFLTDRNNAETKQVRALLESPMGALIKRQFLSPETAALTWIRGQAAMRNAVKNKNGAGANANGRGGVQRGRPASGGTSAGAQPGRGGPSLKTAKEGIQRDGSVGALAQFMDVVGERFAPKTN